MPAASYSLTLNSRADSPFFFSHCFLLLEVLRVLPETIQSIGPKWWTQSILHPGPKELKDLSFLLWNLFKSCWYMSHYRSQSFLKNPLSYIFFIKIILYLHLLELPLRPLAKKFFNMHNSETTLNTESWAQEVPKEKKKRRKKVMCIYWMCGFGGK